LLLACQVNYVACLSYCERRSALHGTGIAAGAQTEHRSGVGTVRDLLGGKDLAGRSAFWSVVLLYDRRLTGIVTTSPPARVTKRAKMRMSTSAFSNG